MEVTERAFCMSWTLSIERYQQILVLLDEEDANVLPHRLSALPKSVEWKRWSTIQRIGNSMDRSNASKLSRVGIPGLITKSGPKISLLFGNRKCSFRASQSCRAWTFSTYIHLHPLSFPLLPSPSLSPYFLFIRTPHPPLNCKIIVTILTTLLLSNFTPLYCAIFPLATQTPCLEQLRKQTKWVPWQISIPSRTSGLWTFAVQDLYGGGLSLI